MQIFCSFKGKKLKDCCRQVPLKKKELSGSTPNKRHLSFTSNELGHEGSWNFDGGDQRRGLN